MTDKPDIDKLIQERPELFDHMDARPGLDRDTGIRAKIPPHLTKAIAARKERQRR